MKPNTEKLDEAIVRKLHEAEAAGTDPEFTQEESARFKTLIRDALRDDETIASESSVCVVRVGDIPMPERAPSERGTVLRLRDILGTESFDDFAKRARSKTKE